MTIQPFTFANPWGDSILTLSQCDGDTAPGKEPEDNLLYCPVETLGKEKIIQITLSQVVNGKMEVPCAYGRIDILTDDQIIEVKNVTDWKSAIGQITVYGLLYPRHEKRIHLFGSIRESRRDPIFTAAKELGIVATFTTGEATQIRIGEIPTSALMSSRACGHGQKRAVRAVRCLMAWNLKSEPDYRYQISYPIVKALTGNSTGTMAPVLGCPAKGIKGTLEEAIKAHHEQLGMTSPVFNRGKPPITNFLIPGLDF